jgi:hypothetical protein
VNDNKRIGRVFIVAAAIAWAIGGIAFAVRGNIVFAGLFIGIAMCFVGLTLLRKQAGNAGKEADEKR